MRFRPVTLLAACGLSVAVAGCAMGPDYDWNVAGVADGSRLTLSTGVAVSSFSGQVYIQDGEVIEGRRVNRYDPYCRLRLRAPSGERPEHIAADTFEVSDYRTWRSVAGASADGIVRLASNRSGGSASFVRYHTAVSLHSANQPAVDELVCQYARDGRAPHLDIEQIRDTLDGLATLEGPGA